MPDAVAFPHMVSGLARDLREERPHFALHFPPCTKCAHQNRFISRAVRSHRNSDATTTLSLNEPLEVIESQADVDDPMGVVMEP